MIKKIALSIVGLLLVVLVGGFGYVEATYQRDFSTTPLPNIKASSDPQIIAQGEYLANSVAHCAGCHGLAGDHKNLSFHPKGDLRGGFMFEAGPFGTFYAANITPDPETGIGKLSDGQIARAIRHGVDRNGKLAAFMALSVGGESDEDLTAIVSYLRSIPPVKNEVPQDAWGLIAKAMSGRMMPASAERRPKLTYVASGTVSVDRGAYLANGPAFCVGCHSPFSFETFSSGEPHFSGEAQAEPDPTDESMEFAIPNLTPDPTTGHITSWSEEAFLQRFQKGRILKGSKMPWENYQQATEADLRSIYRYLRTLPPAHHVIGPPHRKKGWSQGKD